MSTNKWHPFPDEEPPEGKKLLVTWIDNLGKNRVVTLGVWGDKEKGGLFHHPYDWLATPIAWMLCPEPYETPEPEDMHPDAITCRKYMEGDPETVKELEIFDA